MLAGRGARDKIKAEVTEGLRQQDWPQWASPTLMASQELTYAGASALAKLVQSGVRLAEGAGLSQQ